MKKKQGKKKIIIRIIVIVIIIFLLGLCIIPNLFKKEALPSVNIVQAVTGDVAEVLDTSGTVSSENTKIYFSPVNAKISTCDLKVGSIVKKGDKLLEYDMDDLQTQYEKASLQTKATNLGYQDQIEKSNKSAAQASEASEKISSLQSEISAKEAEIESLKGQLPTASNEEAAKKEASLKKEAIDISKKKIEAQAKIDAYLKKEMNGSITEKEKEKLKALQADMVSWNKREVDINAELTALSTSSADASAVSPIQSQIEELTAQLQTLQSKLAEQESIKASSESSVINGSQKAQLNAQQELAKYDSMTAEELLEEAKKGITADFDGIVSAVTAVKGATVTQGAELFTIAQSNSIKVDISLSKYDLEKIKENQTAVITIAGKEYKGTVTRINRIAEKNEKGATLVKAEVRVDNPDNDIFIGIEAKVKINIDSVKDVVVIPVQAINSAKDGDFCYIVEDNIVVKKPVTTGVSSTEYIEIKDGISQGDMVVIDVGNGVEEGAKVLTKEQNNKVMKEQTEDSKNE